MQEEGITVFRFTPGFRVVMVVDVFVSHANHLMGLARALRERGATVEFWGPPQVEHAIRAQGFAFRRLQGLWPFYEAFFPIGAVQTLLHMRAVVTAFKVLRRRWRTLHGALDLFERSLGRHLQESWPQLAVFHPFALAYFPYFASRGIRCATLQDKPLPIADRLVPPPESAAVPSGLLSGILGNALLWSAFRLRASVRHWTRNTLTRVKCYTSDELLREILRRTSWTDHATRIDRGVAYDLHFRQVQEWVALGPEVDFPRAVSLPANVRYVGLCADLRRDTGAVPLERRAGARHVVYVSMGLSMSNPLHDVRVVARIIRALRDIPDTQIVVSTGNEQSRAALADRFPGVDIFSVVPQLAVLRMADLAITHGGSSTFRECVATGTPMLVFPRQFDQPSFAARVCFHGLGLRGSRRFDTRGAIRRKALRILTNPAYRVRIRELGAESLRNEPLRIDAALDDLMGRQPVSGDAARSRIA